MLLPALLATLSAATGSRAPTLFLEWRAPVSCPERNWVLSEVRRVRGQVDLRDEAAAADVAAAVNLTFIGNRWMVRIDTRAAPAAGSRTVEAESCLRAAEAAAAIISLALAPFAPPPAPRPPTSVSAPARNAPPQVEVTPFVEPRSSWRLSVAALATSRVGLLPQVMFGAAAALAVARAGWKVELQVHTPAFQTVTLQDSDVGGRLSLPFSAGLLACRALTGEATTELALCLELDAGLAQGQGLGVTTARSGSWGWLAGAASATLRFALVGGLGARLDASGGVSFVRPQFEIDPGGGKVTLYQVPWFNARAVAGLELIW